MSRFPMRTPSGTWFLVLIGAILLIIGGNACSSAGGGSSSAPTVADQTTSNPAPPVDIQANIAYIDELRREAAEKGIPTNPDLSITNPPDLYASPTTVKLAASPIGDRGVRFDLNDPRINTDLTPWEAAETNNYLAIAVSRALNESIRPREEYKPFLRALGVLERVGPPYPPQTATSFPSSRVEVIYRSVEYHGFNPATTELTMVSTPAGWKPRYGTGTEKEIILRPIVAVRDGQKELFLSFKVTLYYSDHYKNLQLHEVDMYCPLGNAYYVANCPH